LPPGAAQRGTILVAHGVLLPRASRHKQAARMFVRELLSYQSQTALARRTGLLPADVGAWKAHEGDWPSGWVNAAARSIALSPQLRARETAEEFARITASCLKGETTPATAAAQLLRLSAGGVRSARQD
jgi:ABC-type Fe3+ transport system substrate-binding protein